LSNIVGMGDTIDQSAGLASENLTRTTREPSTQVFHRVWGIPFTALHPMSEWRFRAAALPFVVCLRRFRLRAHGTAVFSEIDYPFLKGAPSTLPDNCDPEASVLRRLAVARDHRIWRRHEERTRRRFAIGRCFEDCPIHQSVPIEGQEGRRKRALQTQRGPSFERPLIAR
jgi:hypothetical protein